MHFDAKLVVRALLPMAIVAAGLGCGGTGGGSTAAATSSEAPTPVTVAPPAPTSTPAANQAPTIVTQPSNVARVGEPFNYRPTSTDPEGDTLRFSANNLPGWASVDPATGRITGTPTTADLGAHESITIVVADAARRTESEPFTITVIGTSAAVATVQWDRPPTKVDGTPLDDLAGYRILYGRNAEDLDHSVLISSADTTSYDFATLESGIWYFAVVAVNASGLEGPATTPAQKSI
jgi:hypothetical protein